MPQRNNPHQLFQLLCIFLVQLGVNILFIEQFSARSYDCTKISESGNTVQYWHGVCSFVFILVKLCTSVLYGEVSPCLCWQVFVAGSGKYNEVGYPFGYLKASSTTQVVNLVVMPYNYPLLVPLLGMHAVLFTGALCWEWIIVASVACIFAVVCTVKSLSHLLLYFCTMFRKKSITCF